MLPTVAPKQPALPKADASKGSLSHNPFAELATRKGLVADPSKQVASESANTMQAAAKRELPPSRLKPRMQLETKGRSGKVVTRISGLPEENLPAVATKLAKALGCGAAVEQSDVLLQGSLIDRATQWLQGAGDLRVIQPDVPRRPERVSTTGPTPSVSRSTGTIRAELRRGQRVAIVQKNDQATGRLTEGIVRDLLTNSEVHPRGIKVRLETGEIGRVKVVFD